MSNESEDTSWSTESTREAYEAFEEPEEVRAYQEQKHEYADVISKWDSHIDSALDGSGHNLTEEELHQAIDTREQMHEEMVEVSSNYPGDWTGLLYKRLIDPLTKERFIQRKTEAMEFMKDDSDEMDRREKPKSHYREQIENYDANVDKVFASTQFGPAEVFGKKSKNLGTIGEAGTGAVFSDAEHQGVPLTDRQKNIIEAHEKGHCLRDFASPLDRSELKSVIDTNAILDLNNSRVASGKERLAPTYLSDPMEIAERMAQFKNYFGMGASEQFTKKHLDYVRQHYVADTGLDNNVSDLLFVITPEKEKAFLDIINKYPI